MNVPPLYFDAPQKPFEATFKAIYRSMVESKHGGALLYGSAGTRKTTFGTKLMAEKMLDYITDYGIDGLWSTAPNLLAEIRATYSVKSKETEIEVMQRYSNYGILLIDDLGAEKKTDWSLSAFYSILSNRINYMKFTIITTNLTLEELHLWEPRIASRLGSFQVIVMTGKDWRLH